MFHALIFMAEHTKLITLYTYTWCILLCINYTSNFNKSIKT